MSRNEMVPVAPRSLRRGWPQLVRRCIQLGVLAFIVYTAFGGSWRNNKVAHNNERLIALMDGETAGWLYGLNEDALSLIGEPYQASKQFLGMPWASRVAGLDGVDPIMAASTVTVSHSFPTGVVLGLLLPLGLALVLGKVFCSHLCPARLLFEMGQLVRAGLTRLGLPMPMVRSRARYGGWVLAGGLIASVLAGTAVWFFILPYLAFSTGLWMYVALGTVSSIVAVIFVWLLVDVFFAPGFFCHNLCPTGFVLEQVGRFSALRLRNRGTEPCPSGCDMCEQTCPYGLSPKNRTHDPACDNCGRCAAVCPQRRLVRRVGLPVIGALALLALAPGTAEAHHNKGLPHYGYFENYPQVPTEEYINIDGRWEIGATFFNFQGYERRNSDTPNDVKIYIYLYDLKEDRGYTGPVEFEIRKDGEVVSTFHRDEVDEESVYSSRETMPESGDYELIAHVGGQRAVLPFHIDVGDGGVNWLLVGGLGAPVLLVFGLAIYGRRAQRGGKPRKRRRPAAARAGAGLLLLVALGAPSVADAEPAPEPAAVSQTAEAADEEGEVCPDCGMIDCTMDHYEAADGSQVMVMGGIPLWLFLAGVVGILLVSFAATEWLAPKASRGFRKNLIESPIAYRMVRSRWFQAVPQLLMVAVLGFLIYVGLFGSQVANLTPVAVWTLWWGGLIFMVLLMASAWCFVCPWDGLANLMSRLRLAARVEPLSMNLRFPAWLKNVYPAIALFFLLTWLELGFGVTTDPRWTAYMGIGMAAMAIVAALLFDGKKFCAHACPVGRICGIYSTFAPVEIRARNPRACKTCETEDCLNGNERGYPCPTGLSLKRLMSSSQCTMCTECVKSCNKHNVAINLRPFGSDLRNLKKPRLDEAWLALMLLALTLFHGLSMTPVWESYAPGGTSVLKWMGLTFGTGKIVNFTIAMSIAVAIPILLYWASCRIGARMAGGRVGPATLFKYFAYSLLPVALFYHLAHNLMHLVMEGGHVVPMLSDPMGTGADYLGTRNVDIGHIFGESLLWYLQIGLILIGHIFGILVAHRIAHRVYRGDRKAAARSLIPMLAVMILISIGGLYLMHLDMNMRVGRM